MAQSVKTILQMPLSDIDKMTEAELRATVSILSSAANKRLARLGATERGRMSPAYQSAQERSYSTLQGGKFGVKGKNRNQLRNEYKALSAFFGTKTGSVKGWNKYRSKIYERIGGEFKDVEKEKQFWKNYRIISKDAQKKGIQGYGSTERQADLRRVMNDRNPVDIMREINEQNVSQKRKNRDAYIDNLTNSGYILNENHRRERIDLTDNDDILYLFSLRIGAQYEKENPATTDDEQFFTVQKNK